MIINNLITNVKYVKLYSVTIWDKKFNGVDKKMQPKVIKYPYLLAKDAKSLLSDSGDIFYLNTGINDKTQFADSNLANDFICEGEVVAIPWGGTPNVKYHKGKFITGDNRIATSSDTRVLNNKFLYYVLQSKMKELSSYYRGSGIKHPNMYKVLNMQIPLPPLEIQEKIVEILDKFTDCVTELTAELTLRRKQYEYYRNNIISSVIKFDKYKIDDICINISSGGTPSTSNPSYYGGDIPWLRTQEVNFKDINDTAVKITKDGLKNSSAKVIPSNCVIVAMYGATVGKVAINKIPLSTNQACCNLEINSEKALYKFVFYYLQNEYENLKKLGRGSQTNISANIIKNIEINIPSLKEQQRIVDILDKFDAYCNDLTQGLPAEIEARQKQYEYYRDKLLTFESLKD